MLIKDGVPYIHEYGFDTVATQETTNNRNVSFWYGVCGNKAQNGNTWRIELQVEDDGSSNFWTFINLWVQYFSY